MGEEIFVANKTEPPARENQTSTLLNRVGGWEKRIFWYARPTVQRDVTERMAKKNQGWIEGRESNQPRDKKSPVNSEHTKGDNTLEKTWEKDRERRRRD